MKPRYFDLARKLSKKSTHHQHQLACVIVHKNRVVSMGWNQKKTHSKSIHKFKMLHAEIHALLGCTYDELKGCVAYVYRETKNGQPAMSKPCTTCEIALKLAGIEKVYYTSDEGYKEQVYV